MEEAVSGCGGRCKHIRYAERPIDDGCRRRLCLKIEASHNSERIRSASECLEHVSVRITMGTSRGNAYIVDVGVCRRRGLDGATVCQDDIESNDCIKGEAPRTRAETKASMSRVAAHSNARTCTMGQSTLSLVEDCLGEIAKPHSTANLGNIVGVKADLLEALEVDDHGAILPS